MLYLPLFQLLRLDILERCLVAIVDATHRTVLTAGYPGNPHTEFSAWIKNCADEYSVDPDGLRTRTGDELLSIYTNCPDYIRRNDAYVVIYVDKKM